MTLTPAQIEQFVDDLYAATAVGDFDKAADMLTDDFFVTEADNLPMAGIYRGRNALKELFTKVMGLMDVAGLERVQTLVGGDYAVTYLSFRFADPALKSAELCELFRFRDGKCCEIKPFYFDPATVHAAVAAKQAALTA
ncbi:MAG TPA: nuclear transport factor 2 family protein [Novosphingobium sp.]|nr:nuclear transport factor 2 family protein [Novosphingobium sp.]